MASRAVPRTTPAIPAMQPSSSSIKFLMSPTQVEGVVGAIKQQIRVFMGQVVNPAHAMVEQVIGGAWKGDGATRFVEEMKSLVLPQLLSVWGMTISTAEGIDKAKETMLNADNQAGKIASSLMDEFKGIYH
jgi:hypothetical protein